MVSWARMSPTRPSPGDPHTWLGTWDALELLEVGVKEDAEAVEVDILPAGLGHRGAACLGWGGTGTHDDTTKSAEPRMGGWGGAIPGAPPGVATFWGPVPLMSPQKDQFWVQPP